jgi:hypothetical protein
MALGKISHSEACAGWLCTFFACLALVCGPAAARPRDDVLSGAFRCASIPDLRTWLDCYYGAAQPARQALDLPPAPKSQAQLVVAPPAGSVAAADVALHDEVMAEAFRCNGLNQDRLWLDCYYAAAQPARARLGLSPAPQATLPVKPETSSFGLKLRPQPGPGQETAHMTAYQFARDGIFTARLDNGQVWRQVEGDVSFARWNKPAANYEVRITPGLFGSFNFEVARNPGVYKVRRLQ